jgi:hypothetical protein
MVHIARLIDAFRKTLWRHGAVSGGELSHRVDEHGDHHIDVTISAKVAEYDPPKRHDGPWPGFTTPGPKR